MAINKILSTSKDESLEESDFATRGSVVNSFVDYNKQIQDKYYDKNENDSQLNTIQKSLLFLNKVLDKNTDTKKEFEDKNSINEIEKDAGKEWKNSGLVEKVEILGNIVSGGNSHQTWNRTIKANIVGRDNTISSVPVIGTTKVESDYKFEDNGLLRYYYNNWSSSNIPTPTISGYEKSLSKNMVLSEYQVVRLVESVATSLTENFGKKLSEVQTETNRSASNSTNAYSGILAHINTIGVPAYWPVSVECVAASTEESLSSMYKFSLVNGTLYGPLEVIENDWVKPIVSRSPLVCHCTSVSEITEYTDIGGSSNVFNNKVEVILPMKDKEKIQGFTVSYTIYSDDNLQEGSSDDDDLPDFKVVVPLSLFAPKLCGTDAWFTKSTNQKGEAIYSQFDFSTPITEDINLYTRMYTKTEGE